MPSAVAEECCAMLKYFGRPTRKLLATRCRRLQSRFAYLVDRSGRGAALSQSISLTGRLPRSLALDFCPHGSTPFLPFLVRSCVVLVSVRGEARALPLSSTEHFACRRRAKRGGCRRVEGRGGERERERRKMTTTDSRTTASGEEQGTNEPREKERERGGKEGRRRQEAQEQAGAGAGARSTRTDSNNSGLEGGGGSGRSVRTEREREESFRRLRLPCPKAAPVWK